MFALVTKTIPFIICFCFCLTKLFGQPLNFLAPTLYRQDFNIPCGNTDVSYDYFYIPFCRNGVPPNSTQLQVSLEIPVNPDFEPSPPGQVICIQLSKCKDDFSQPCVFATNYVFNTTNFQIYGFGNLVINTDRFCPDITNCTIYMRAMAQPIATQYSVQLTFVSSKPEDYLAYTIDSPWSGSGINSAVKAKELSQYFQSDQTYQASVNEFTYFYIGYCPQTTPVYEIQLQVTSVIGNTVTLLQVFACPKNSVNSNYLECQAQSAKVSGFYSPDIAPFLVLPCKNTANTPLNDGIYGVVQTAGNSTNKPNEFKFQAIIEA